MSFRIATIASALLLTAIIAACGDDDGPSGSSSGSATTSGTATTIASRTSGPIDTGDGKTPAPSGETDAPTVPATAPGEIPTAPPTASEGTPAVRPTDEATFLSQFAGQDITFIPCSYNPANALTDCGNRGRYAIDPPIVGQDISCDLWVIEETPRAMQCRSVEPTQTINYEIE